MKKVFLIICLSFLISNTASSEILFHEDFNWSADWELYQPTIAGDSVVAMSTWPGDVDQDGLLPTEGAGWNMAYSGASYYTNKGHNNIEVSSLNRRGTSGRGATFWNESDTRGDGWNSDNQIGYMFTTGQNEIYIRFYKKYQKPFYWMVDGGQIKSVRATHWKNHDISPFDFFNNSGPGALQNPATYGGDPCTAHSWRYNNVYYPDDAIPEHVRAVPFYFNGASVGGNRYTDETGYSISENFEATGNTGDGDWHLTIIRIKLNSAAGVADGIMSEWFDGVMVANTTDLAFIDQGGDIADNFQFFTIGGNSYNHFAPNVDEQEQWYAIDDLVVATTYQEAVDGPSGPAYNSPTITGPNDFSTTESSVEINGSYTTDPNLPDQPVIITWTLGEASGFCVAALGVFSCTVPDPALGANSIVFEITDSESATANDTTVVTRTAIPSGASAGVTLQGVQWNQ